jgi:YbbR domain-containing protein
MRSINWPVLIASIALSFTLWFVVSAQNRSINYVQLEVQIDGLDQDLVYVKDKPRSISVMVRGNPGSIRGLVDDNARAVVQLDQAKMGVSSYSVRVVPDRLRQLLVDQNPTVSIELEPIETREVTVSVETSGKLSDNRYVLEDLLSSPSKVEVRGPKSQIKDATRVMAVIDLTSVEPNRAIPYTVNVQIQNAAGANIQYALATPSTVSITPTFAPAPIEFPAFVSLDLKSVKAADGFEIVGYTTQPEQVTVYGTSLNVARVGTVRTAPILASQIRETQTIEVPLVTPRGVSVRPRTVRVTIEVRPKAAFGVPPVQPPVSNDGNTADPGTRGGTVPEAPVRNVPN